MEAAAQAAHTKLPKGVIVLLVVLRMSWGNLLIYISNFNIYVFFFFNMYFEISRFQLVVIQSFLLARFIFPFLTEIFTVP